MKKTLYQILGVGPQATREEIVAAYQKASESAAGDPNAAVFAREALQILSDPSQRAAYDASLTRAAAAPPRRPALAEAHGDEDVQPWFGASWVKWAAGLVVLAAFFAWWKSRAPATPPPPVSVQTIQVIPERVIVISASEASPAEEPPAAPQPYEDVAQPASTEARSAEEVFSEVSPSVVRVAALDGATVLGQGSGVVIDSELVVTNCHVLRSGKRFQVKSGNAVHDAVTGVADEEYDLCRLHVAGLAAPAAQLGSVSSLRPGQKVYAIGAPQGLELSLSDGIVSSLRDVPGGQVIQITAPISAGSSGGGLFDGSGALVGITTYQHRYGQNLNFAVPADWIGEMRQRRVGARGSSTLPTGAVAGSTPEAMIVGKWLCFGSITGNNGEFTFSRDRTVIAAIFGRKLSGGYAISGRTLHFPDNVAFAIESMTPDKMVLDPGNGHRVVCERT